MRLFAAAMLLVAMTAMASDYTRDGGTADFMCCSDKSCTTVISQHADAVRARDTCGKLTDADGITRYVRSNAFRITKPGTPTCPPAPASTTRTQQCPAGTTGTWTQTSTSTVGQPTACTVTTTWAPDVAPAGACMTTPPQPLAAPVLSSTQSPNATNPTTRINVTASWTSVALATGYQLERCTGATCTDFVAIAGATTSPYVNSNIPNNLTYSFRVKATDGTLTSISNVLIVAPPPTGSASLQWTPPTQNTDGSTLTNLAGYRIWYGNAPTQLFQKIDVNNPGVSTYIVNGLTSGTWYFAVASVTSAGGESENSNVALAVVP